MSPLSIQVPLLHPDRYLEQVRPWLSWCFSFPAVLLWCLAIGWAVRDLVIHSDRLSDASAGVLAVGNWLWLALAWLVLKTLHECGHAVACKRLGGEVREAGVIFILLAPLAYVDVTSTWRLQSKWARIQVAASGMYVELFFAAVATLVWARAPLGVLHNVCFNVMTTASVMTVLFNANPLMRFDGYYILSDLLELPNLYSQGQQYVASLVRRLLFGIRSQFAKPAGWRGGFVRGYGIASLGWRYSVFGGLVLTAATILEGAGIVLSGLAIVLWIGSGARRFVHLVRDPSIHAIEWTRCIVVASGAIALVGAGLVAIPWPGTVVAPAIVRYASESIVRTESDGFVQDVRVSSGQQVAAGEVLVALTNRDLEHELADLKLAIARLPTPTACAPAAGRVGQGASRGRETAYARETIGREGVRGRSVGRARSLFRQGDRPEPANAARQVSGTGQRLAGDRKRDGQGSPTVDRPTGRRCVSRPTARAAPRLFAGIASSCRHR